MESYQLAIYRCGTTSWIGPDSRHIDVIEKKYIFLDPLTYRSDAVFVGKPFWKYVILNTQGAQTGVLGPPMTYDQCFNRIMSTIADEIFLQRVLNSTTDEIQAAVLKCVKNYQILPCSW